MVAAVLAESDRPLHYTEITQLCNERSGRSVEVRRAHQAAANVGLLFGRGIYGLTKHYPLTDEETGRLVQNVEKIVGEHDENRQWHATELVHSLEAVGVNLEERLSPYVLSIALRQSTVLVNLKRMMWGMRRGLPGQMHRIDVQQAVLAMLQAEGAPMLAKDIRDRIAAERGLGDYFQISRSDHVVPLGGGRWGLIDRDVPLNREEIEEIHDVLEKILEDRGGPIEVPEMVSALQTRLLYLRDIDPSLLLALAKLDDRFSVSVGQEVFLRSWGMAAQTHS